MTTLGHCAIEAIRHILPSLHGAQGAPLQTQLVRGFLTAAGTNRQCLPEIATAPLGPRNDTSGQHSDGNGAAHRIGGTTAASRTGGACPAPTGPVRIERRLVQIGSAFPRLPRPLWGLAMTRQGSTAMGTVRRTELAVLLPLRGRAGHAPPLQDQCGFNGGRCESAVPARDCHVASLLAMTRQGSAVVHQCPPAVECSPSGRSLSAATGPVGADSILTIACTSREYRSPAFFTASPYPAPAGSRPARGRGCGGG